MSMLEPSARPLLALAFAAFLVPLMTPETAIGLDSKRGADSVWVDWNRYPTGTWLLGSDPRVRLHIREPARGVLDLDAAGLFHATARLEAGQLEGNFVSRADSADTSHTALPAAGMLRGTFTDWRTLRLEFRATAPAPGIARRTWRYRGWSHLSGLPNRPTIWDSDSLPSFGDYVYVEEIPEVLEKTAPEAPRGLQLPNDPVVMVQVLVDAEGKLRDARVVKSIPALDEAAIRCVARWRYKAATVRGRPVACWFGVALRFGPPPRRRPGTLSSPLDPSSPE